MNADLPKQFFTFPALEPRAIIRFTTIAAQDPRFSQFLIADATCPKPDSPDEVATGTYEKCRNLKIVTPDEFGTQNVEKLDSAMVGSLLKSDIEVSHEEKYYFASENFDASKPFICVSIIVPIRDGKVVSYAQGYIKINTSELSDQNYHEPVQNVINNTLEVHNILIAGLKPAARLPNLDDKTDILVEAGTIGDVVYMLTYPGGKPLIEIIDGE